MRSLSKTSTHAFSIFRSACANSAITCSQQFEVRDRTGWRAPGFEPGNGGIKIHLFRL